MVQVSASVDSELLILIGLIGCTESNGQKFKVGQALNLLFFVAAVFHRLVTYIGDT